MKKTQLLLLNGSLEGNRWIKMPLLQETRWIVRDILVTPLLVPLIAVLMAYTGLRWLLGKVTLRVALTMVLITLFCACL